LITKGTIEERIFELQAKKKAMIESVIKPGETMLSKMTAQDVQQLFEFGVPAGGISKTLKQQVAKSFANGSQS